MKDDFVVEGSTVKRMRMAHQGGMRSILGARVQLRLKPSGWTVEKQRADWTGLRVHGSAVETSIVAE